MIVKQINQAPESSSFAARPTPGKVFIAPRTLPRRIDASSKPDTSAVVFGQMGSALTLGDLVGSNATTRSSVAITVEPGKNKAPTRVSAGVSAGQLLTPIKPIYPLIAKIAHIEGAVFIEALISRKGTIESLRVVSGPVTLQPAAIEAIKAARYKPFKLNGEPIEVQTTITINFRLGN